MQKITYQDIKEQTEDGIVESKKVSILLTKEGQDNRTLHVERKEGVTTISVTEEERHEPHPLERFSATIEDDKIKIAISSMGEMILNIGKLALLKYFNEVTEENT